MTSQPALLLFNKSTYSVSLFVYIAIFNMMSRLIRGVNKIILASQLYLIIFSDNIYGHRNLTLMSSTIHLLKRSSGVFKCDTLRTLAFVLLQIVLHVQ